MVLLVDCIRICSGLLVTVGCQYCTPAGLSLELNLYQPPFLNIDPPPPFLCLVSALAATSPE